MIFIDENGEPKLINHQCDSSRKGQPITQDELQKFAIELLTDLYQKEGMLIKDINKIQGYEFPQFVMESKNNKRYYVVVKAAIYPSNPLNLSKDNCEEIKELSKNFNAIPVFAGISFANAVSQNPSQVFCGGAYFVSFRGLQAL